LVNGKVWPFLTVEPRKYRFRMLDGSNTRFYWLQLDSGQLFYQIGTDSGLMEYPIGVKEMILAPAERAEVIIDFTNLEGKKIVMTNEAHPIHLHLVDLQLIDRRPFNVEKYKQEKILEYTGPAIPPVPQERGRKDTVISYAQHVPRIIMKFGPYTGLYVWHCHILEHEDYVMMRPFRVIP
jgi:FtsP/CotA-like multicopper oxidase with cupredoxin domain